MSTTAGWDGLLSKGETLVWQGQPESGVDWARLFHPLTLMGVIFTGFSIFWIGAAMSILDNGPGGIWMLFPLFGVPFLLIGLYMLVGRLLVDAYIRSHTWYTLTDRTAFIAVDMPGRKWLDSYPLRDMDMLRLEDGIPGSIVFGQTDRRHGTGAGAHATPRQVGFHRITYARELYGQMRQLRQALRRQGSGTE
ncbi:hypothetical protein roselon_00690 [Roseibacterium elongatum DSM 19469]|uniref:DUF304 domain-containing protein n=1 Tax=Roseicyclus elongatus DSM 19469 TaxID=1294273 RepID=W8RPL8_9RHOB|nr:hypothetical protein [Roseibacterium elongatum]AHM03119.1 hypothetical protein roselon_00690 [Roseibacterium elongatum DSM 19469]